jgi:hypothetical protein
MLEGLQPDGGSSCAQGGKLLHRLGLIPEFSLEGENTRALSETPLLTRRRFLHFRLVHGSIVPVEQLQHPEALKHLLLWHRSMGLG